MCLPIQGRMVDHGNDSKSIHHSLRLDKLCSSTYKAVQKVRRRLHIGEDHVPDKLLRWIVEAFVSSGCLGMEVV